MGTVLYAAVAVIGYLIFGSVFALTTPGDTTKWEKRAIVIFWPVLISAFFVGLGLAFVVAVAWLIAYPWMKS